MTRAAPTTNISPPTRAFDCKPRRMAGFAAAHVRQFRGRRNRVIYIQKSRPNGARASRPNWISLNIGASALAVASEIALCSKPAATVTSLAILILSSAFNRLS